MGLPALRPSQDTGGDVCCSPCLGLYYQLSDLAGYWGRCMLFSLSGPLLPALRPSQDTGGDVCCSPCLGLYYQLSDLAGYWGRCMLFSLSGSLLPAFRPCWILGEMS